MVRTRRLRARRQRRDHGRGVAARDRAGRRAARGGMSMLAALVRFSVLHARIAALGAILLLTFGALRVVSARYDVFPEFVPAQADVQTEAPGLAPEQVELLVTRPLENAVMS